MRRSVPIIFIFIIALSRTAAAFDADWGGHVKLLGGLTHYDDTHYMGLAGEGRTFIDGAAQLRLTSQWSLSDRITFDIHYEVVASGGQTREAVSRLPRGNDVLRLISPAPSDDQNLLSMTDVLADEDDYIIYHRIDRLAAAYSGDLATFRIGRQALTWGNGLIFNPMDLFNPFAPSDIIRDYKSGLDMAVLQAFAGGFSDIQLVWVPRRSLESGTFSSSDSTYGAKFKFATGEIDVDLMMARDWGDPKAGLGLVGYWGDAAWRADALWTVLAESDTKNGFLAAVANIDYAWNWIDRSWYGFVELFHNGLGDDDALAALQEPALRDRISRGQLFTTARWYLDGLVQVELHPLVQAYISAIWNLEDRSILLQPRLSWDATGWLRILLGANVASGDTGTEFGGIVDPETGRQVGQGSRLYLQLTGYF